MEKISITRALNTLKLLDKKISKSIESSQFANYTVGGKSYLDKYTPNEDLQSINDLISYRARLKSAIMASNAVTLVTVGDIKMTVVQAIETKDSIKYRKQLLRKIKQDLANVERIVTDTNEQVQVRLDRLVEASLGSDKSKSEYDAIAKPFLEKNEAKSVDSVKYDKIAKDLEAEIDLFESEVDLVLSESNATTFIEV